MKAIVPYSNRMFKTNMIAHTYSLIYFYTFYIPSNLDHFFMSLTGWPKRASLYK